MFVTQEIGEAGQYGFGFAGKDRGRADDSVRIGRPISENQNRSKAEHQAGICYSVEITCKGIFREKDNPKCENIGYAIHHRNYKDGCRNKNIANHRGCGTDVSGNHRGQKCTESGEIHRWI